MLRKRIFEETKFDDSKKQKINQIGSENQHFSLYRKYHDKIRLKGRFSKN
jgi:hypothetical protein